MITSRVPEFARKMCGFDIDNSNGIQVPVHARAYDDDETYDDDEIYDDVTSDEDEKYDNDATFDDDDDDDDKTYDDDKIEDERYRND